MDIFQYFQQRLRELRDSGLTNREIAEKAGVTHSHINRMLNKDTSFIETVGLRTLVRLFPDIFEMILCQSGQTAIANGGSVAINGNNNIVATLAAEKQRFANEVLDDDKMCAECKVRVLQMLKK